ncbi:MAG: glycosyltransferase family 39 protein [Planctomycetota bacterium]
MKPLDWRDAAVVLGVSALVFFIGLGTHPFRSTEGHRVAPAWAMLETGDVRTPRLFETVYVRKPLGMPWAIGVSSAAFGQHEFGARVPSALAGLALAMLSWAFARVWFGHRWGLAAGLGAALFPALWPPGRAAEIEMLMIAATGAAAFGVIECCRRGGVWPLICIGLGVFVSGAAKGPAGLPVIAAACAGGVFVLRPRSRHVLAAMVATGIGLLAALLAIPGDSLGEPVVRQGVGDFLYTPERLLELPAFGPMVALTAMPLVLAMLLPWGPDARREGERSQDAGARHRVALALAWAFALALVVYTLAGVANPRYGLPAVVVLPPLVAYAARGAFSPDEFLVHRARIARWMFLGARWSWPAVLLGAFIAWVAVAEPRRAETSAFAAAESLAPHLEPGEWVWAESQADTRPELLLYLEQMTGVRAYWAYDEVQADPPTLAPASRPAESPQVEPPDALILTLPERDLLVEMFGAEAFREVARVTVRARELVLVRPTRPADTMAAP